jgi:hypothetical protein
VSNNRQSFSTACLLWALLPGLGACSTADDPGAAGSGGTGAMPVMPPGSLPFAVDDYFAPSGYMRDARNGNAVMTPLGAMGDSTCGGARSPVAAPRGFCHTVTFTTFGTMPELTWGGVYWQYPEGNWGELPGLAVPPGATKIKFQAHGDLGGEVVGFFVGGVGADENKPHADSFELENMDLTLSAEWQPYELSLPVAADYSAGVVGGFGWGVGAAGNTLPVKFYLDDIVWE